VILLGYGLFELGVSAYQLPWKLLLIFLGLWAYWHVVRQHYGFLRLYQKKNADDHPIDARLDSMTVQRARPPLSTEQKGEPTHDQLEHKAAFGEYVRRGESANLRALEQKAMSVGSNPDGGYTVPVEIETAIGKRLAVISPIRKIAGVREISGSVYKKPFMTTGPAVGWVGETDARTQTGSPTLDSLSFPAMELYAMPAATAALLEDSAVNIDEWLAGTGALWLDWEQRKHERLLVKPGGECWKPSDHTRPFQRVVASVGLFAAAAAGYHHQLAHASQRLAGSAG
jgi:hypothetical protein